MGKYSSPGSTGALLTAGHTLSLQQDTFPDPPPLPTRRSGARATVAGYVFAAALSLLLVIVQLQLWRGSLTLPLAWEGDSVLAYTNVKTMMEEGWFLTSHALGAPGILELHDHPEPDFLHYAIMKGMLLVLRQPILVVNLYYLLTYPLTTLLALFVLRRLGLGYPVSLAAGLIYTFAPYHWLRFPHLFLAAYYLLPLMILIVLRLYQGQTPFLHPRPKPGAARWHLLSRTSLGALMVAVLVGVSGAYYAFFSSFLLLVAGALASFRLRTLACLASAAGVVAIILSSMLVCLLPNYLYWREHGPNPEHFTQRHPRDADIAGLRINQLLHPLPYHRLPAAEKLHNQYGWTFGPNFTGETVTSAFGLVGAVGLLYLLGRLFWHRPDTGPGHLLDGLTTLNLAAILLATVGGFGALFNLYVSASIRAYNRISIFMLFFALTALSFLAEQLLRRCSDSKLRRGLFGAGLVIVLGIALFDQQGKQMPPYELGGPNQVPMRVLRAFVHHVEAATPAGSMVCQLPLTRFPESAGAHRMGSYDHFRPYLFSQQVHWTFGAMRGRLEDAWQARLAEQPLPEQMLQLASAGFAGIFIDRNGYADAADKIEAELADLLDTAPLVSADRAYSYFSLDRYVARVRRWFSPEQWQRQQDLALRPSYLRWGEGFYGAETLPGGDVFHWCQGTGELTLCNPGTSPRNITLRMKCFSYESKPVLLHLSGDLLQDDRPICISGTVIEKHCVLPPGQHRLRMVCDSPPIKDTHGDARILTFQVFNLKLEPEEECIELHKRILEPCRVLWGQGFYGVERMPSGEAYHWCQGTGELTLCNPSKTARAVVVRMKCLRPARSPAPLHITGDVLRHDDSISRSGTLIEKRCVLTPGRHVLKLVCDSPPLEDTHGDERTLSFQVCNVKIEEACEEQSVARGK